MQKQNNLKQQNPESSEKKAALFWLFLQLICILFFGLFCEYGPSVDTNDLSKNQVYDYYNTFQDVHVMMFIGFGYLMTFLVKYWYGAVGFTFYISAFVIQWSILMMGFWHQLIGKQDLKSKYHWHKIPVNISTLINADYAVASMLISFGGIIGKVSFNQLSALIWLELIFYTLNEAINVTRIKVTDVGGSMLIHVFGAYFGLTASLILTNHKKLHQYEKNETTSKTSDLFSLIGTIFLWMFWPSFNCGLVPEPGNRHRTIQNTVLTLCVSCICAFLCSKIFRNGKFNLVDIQNATLAGGVAIGASANLIQMPFGCMLIGGIAGILSTFGFAYLQPFLRKKINLHDTCGIHNLHGMPGVLGGLSSIIAAGIYYDENIKPLNPDQRRSNGDQAGLQAACLFITLGIAIGGGIFSAYVVKFVSNLISPVDNEVAFFNDVVYWDIKEDIEDKAVGGQQASYSNIPKLQSTDLNNVEMTNILALQQ